jgi:hypothetical protein
VYETVKAWVSNFYVKGLHRFLWAGSWAACGKITASRIPNCLNYCEIVIIYTGLTNVATDRIVQLGGPRVGDTCVRTWFGGSDLKYLLGMEFHMIS